MKNIFRDSLYFALPFFLVFSSLILPTYGDNPSDGGRYDFSISDIGIKFDIVTFTLQTEIDIKNLGHVGNGRIITELIDKDGKIIQSNTDI